VAVAGLCQGRRRRWEWQRTKVVGEKTQETPSASKWRRTFVFDLLQALPHGVVETAAATFAMFIAIRVFDVSVVGKMMIAAASAAGFFVSLFIVPIVRRIGVSVNIASACIWLLGGIGFIVAALAGDSESLYLVGVLAAMIALTVATPLIAQIHRTAYPDHIRGTLFSIGGLLRAIVAAGFGFGAGWWLDANGMDFRPLMYVFALSYVLKSACVLGMPSVKLRKSNKLSLLEAFKHAGEDMAFRTT